MKIVKLEGKKTGDRIRSDLARLSVGEEQVFLTGKIVRDYLDGKEQLDYKVSKHIHSADKSVRYMERFIKRRDKVDKIEYLVALLCSFSEDSLGTEIISEDFFEYENELQELLTASQKHNDNGYRIAEKVSDFMIEKKALPRDSFAVWFLLYNFFLYQEKVCLILEDKDTPGTALLMDMKYLIIKYANK